MRNYTEKIRAQHDGKIYREVITFTDLDKNGNKIIVELLRGRRGKAEYIAVDVTRLGGFLIFDNIILLCRRLCAMLLMYSLINCIFIFNCVNCLCNSIQLYCLWWLINCACLLPFFWWWISLGLYCCCMSKDNNAFICVLRLFECMDV